MKQVFPELSSGEICCGLEYMCVHYAFDTYTALKQFKQLQLVAVGSLQMYVQNCRLSDHSLVALDNLLPSDHSSAYRDL